MGLGDALARFAFTSAEAHLGRPPRVPVAVLLAPHERLPPHGGWLSLRYPSLRNLLTVVSAKIDNPQKSQSQYPIATSLA
jgi:hypothetical protein